MKIGPKYKIARRVNAPVFEKTQTQKYAIRLERKSKSRNSRPKTEYGLQMNEKQKAKYVYGLREKQFSKYVREAVNKKNSKPAETVFEFLESRLDNVTYRAGFAPTRFAARQMTSHGHISVNGKRVYTPSMRLRSGDIIEITPRSVNKPLFSGLSERMADITPPAWIKLDKNKKVAEVVGVPVYSKQENLFDLNTVVEFYSR